MTSTMLHRAMAIALGGLRPRVVIRGYVGGIAAQLIRQQAELGPSNPHTFPTGRRYLRRARGGPIGQRYTLRSAALTLRSYLTPPAGAWEGA